MKIYCFSGLGADERVFSLLKLYLPFELINIPWIAPKKNEFIESYSLRISKMIEVQKPFGILGVSFGGLIAQEVSSILNPKFTIVISSISSKSQMPLLLKWLPNYILKSIPVKWFKIPSLVSNYIFSAQQKDLLQKILKDTDPEFVKWALFAFKNWKSQTSLAVKFFFICGERDRLFKPINDVVVIKNGGHFMIVDLADKLSVIINDFLVKIK
jgi:pimeloyl-ACP methyl ester carboxylesterase